MKMMQRPRRRRCPIIRHDVKSPCDALPVPFCGARHWLQTSVSLIFPGSWAGVWCLKFEPDAANLSSGYADMAGQCSWPTSPVIGIDRADRRLARDDLLDLANR